MSDRVWRPAAYPLINLTRKIIGGFYSTYHDIRYGFLERVYQRGLTVELQHMGLQVQEEVRFEIYHRGVCIGVYRADHVVEGQVVLEIKTGPLLDPMAVQQCLNHLSVSKLPLGLVLYYGPKPLVKRVVRTEQITPGDETLTEAVEKDSTTNSG